MADAEENLVMVVNFSEWLPSEALFQQILGKELPSSQRISEVVSCYPWRIENKYYCADVKFLLVKNRDVGADQDIIENKNCNATLVIFDPTKKSFDLVKHWSSNVKSHDSSVLLLVGSKYDHNVMQEEIQVLSRLQVIEWCIDHSFEFIDLNEEIDPQDDFPDTVGVPRIVQALQAAEWSSMELKESANHSTIATGTEDSLSSSHSAVHTNDEESISLEGNSSTSQPNSETTDHNSSTSKLDMFGDTFDGITDPELSDEASFEQLFSQMKMMKEKAQSLPHEERKAYAEQVAVAFWRAIGGDEEEIKNLNESED